MISSLTLFRQITMLCILDTYYQLQCLFALINVLIIQNIFIYLMPGFFILLVFHSSFFPLAPGSWHPGLLAFPPIFYLNLVLRAKIENCPLRNEIKNLKIAPLKLFFYLPGCLERFFFFLPNSPFSFDWQVWA